ncbi:MAG TPA: GHKL domain-containing protein [Clostridia bacterium]|nr:GHKL domain-containing protein [Clostridia bacterium]
MFKNSYKNAMMIYVLQMILIVVLLNNNFMKAFDIFQPKSQELFRFFIGILIFILNFFSIFVLRELYAKNKEERQFLINSIKFKYIEEQNRIYRKNHHDLKNHLLIISELVKEKRYVELEKYLNLYMEEIDKNLISINTGVNEIDILLYSKINNAKSKGIDVKFKCDTQIQCGQKHVLNLVSVLGNLIDNAIEACEEMEGEKCIVISIGEDPIDYIFHIRNTSHFEEIIEPSVLFEEGFSTKGGSGRGEGLYIVKNIVEKYRGEIKVETQEGYFDITIEIPKFSLEGDGY